MKHNRIVMGIGAIGLAVLLLMVTFTSPTEVGPFGVLLFFTTLYLVLFSAFSGLLWLFLHFAIQKKSLSYKEQLYAAVFAFGPIMLLLARAFDALNYWTLGLIALFLFLAEFLVHKRI